MKAVAIFGFCVVYMLSYKCYLVDGNYTDNVELVFLPIEGEGEYTISDYEEKVVQITKLPCDYSDDLSVSLSTASPTPVKVKLRVSTEHIHISLDEKINRSVAVAAPSYLMYKFPNNDKSLDKVFLHVESSDDHCMVVSVQNIHCPIYDLETNIRLEGSFQSMTRSAGILIRRDDFPRGFYVVLLHTVDKLCVSSEHNSTDSLKHISVTLSRTLVSTDYVIALSAVILGVLCICVAVNIAVYFYMKHSLPEMYKKVPGASDGTAAPLNGTEQQNESVKKTVKDLSKKGTTHLNRKTKVYLWFLLIIALLYFIPVIQLVISHQKTLVTTGDQNLCYYNFLCAHPLGYLSDFNHVISNSGYILAGICFLVMVYIREKYHREAARKNAAIAESYGIPQHFGLFYAMGAALILEGIFSGCYHVCPSSSNFQFDTSFMYIILMMCAMKMYHGRHPDLSTPAWGAFGILAGAILLGVLGVLYPSHVFWGIFTAIHLLFFLNLSLQFYSDGSCQWRKFKTQCDYALNHKTKFTIIMIANLINWGVAIFGYIELYNDFATHLLAVFLVNLVIYTIIYIIMKIIQEKVALVPWACIVLSVITWSASLYCFYRKSATWKLTAAESKQYNQPCLLLQFYDFHDIWHFLSAVAMFFSFIVFLTIDDDLIATLRDNIRAF